MTMLRKFILGTASVLALGIGGAALDFSADADDVANASENTLSTPETSHHWINAGKLSKDDIRWAQTELHFAGLYNGSLDGVMGPETKQALVGFQKSNGLKRTATLDQPTADALTGDTGGIGQGSSSPPRNAGAGLMTSSSGTSDFGSRGGQNR
jgi:peptidoglycan hydrolase-like protein with peptidoglycan-binding domain